MRRPRKILAAVVILVVVGIAAWTAAQRARRANAAHELRVSGMVEATTVDVAPEVAGTVARVMVEQGDVVRRGEVLAQLDTATLRARLAAAQAQAQQAMERAREAQGAVEIQGATLAANIGQARAARDAAAALVLKLRRGSRPQEIAAAEKQARQAQEAVRAAEAAVQAAQAQLQRLRAGFRAQEIEQARARVARVQAEADQALADRRRLEDLAAQGAVSAQTAETARARHQAAQAELEAAQQQLALVQAGARSEDIAAAEADLKRAQAERERARAAHEAALAALSLVREGPRREDIEAAAADLARAESALAAAQAQARSVKTLRQQAAAALAQQRAAEAAARETRIRLGQATLYAPCAGVVEAKIAEPGETVNAGSPVVRLVNLDDVWLTVYVPERAVGRVKVGQRVRVMVDSFPGRGFPGLVESIAAEAEFTPKYVQTPDERSRLVYAVKVRLDNRERVFKPGMPADAVIELGARGGGR